MKNEKIIVAVLAVLLVVLAIAAAFASQVAPKGNMQYSSFPGKTGRLEAAPVPVQAVPIAAPTPAPIVP